MKPVRLFFVLLFFVLGCEARDPAYVAAVKNSQIDESSGLAKSRQYPGVFWTHNDSGGKPRIYPLFFDPKAEKKYYQNSVKVKGADNVDWEEIAPYQNNRLIIGDFGNNANDRRDLKLYIIKEPDPYKEKKVRIEKVIPFHFEDQDAFPPKMRNFDCEAMFARGEDIYLLSKHRSDTFTTLYKLVGEEARVISRFDVGSRVTAADISEDGKYVAVLTYDYLWLFEGEGEDIFAGKAYKKAIKLGQCEALCFDGDAIIITNEEGEIYRFKLKDLIP